VYRRAGGSRPVASIIARLRRRLRGSQSERKCHNITIDCRCYFAPAIEWHYGIF
jgi:hypothetical protein